ncbi:MAG: helix-turn-helix domain-containing protein [candidate division Zixibacteria bacterium]|nr:helix-turn-helix domain-containing protein [candidate division Zixibacteria bacterium]NIT52726.1 helix-turn-helix domain-containing protein [candidate division Zixibacteria bacterium]NIV04832.1 helix-turn-helix domain-containing protein [candidate division Zixibacteria bacterium]NIX57270.1 helix-turn-helix domain-containing protein [candidate division Zixibacteria bacterium]NIX79669.1 helix-turn-helix domain-containing protein [candidate division Zixibacteria bacterium]
MLEKPFYTAKDVATVLHLSLTSVYKFINSGELEAYQVGKSWRIKPDVFKKFVKKNGG